MDDNHCSHSMARNEPVLGARREGAGEMALTPAVWRDLLAIANGPCGGELMRSATPASSEGDEGWYGTAMGRIRGMGLIALLVACFYRLSLNDLKGPARRRRISQPRQVAMALCQQLLPVSHAVVAAYFGRRSHCAVIHAMRQVRKTWQSDRRFAAEFDALRQSAALALEEQFGEMSPPQR